MIRLLSTLGGARRASLGGPIIRLLNDPEHAFIVGLPGSASIMAVDPATGRADGTVKVVDLMAGDLVSSPPVEAGDDQRQGVTEAGHSVLDMVDKLRGERADLVTLARNAYAQASEVRSGPLDQRREEAIKAAARLILAVELIDEEIGAPKPPPCGHREGSMQCDFCMPF